MLFEWGDLLTSSDLLDNRENGEVTAISLMDSKILIRVAL